MISDKDSGVITISSKPGLVELVAGQWPTEAAFLEVISSGPPGVPGPAGVQGNPGIQGVPGPAGPPGALFEQTFTNPDTVWFVSHGMNTYPVVSTFDTNGSEVEGDVTYPDRNHVVITFAVPFAGIARLKA